MQEKDMVNPNTRTGQLLELNFIVSVTSGLLHVSTFCNKG